MANIITIPEGAIVNDIDIYIDKQTNLPFVNARQYDSGMRYIRASIWNDGDLYPMVASDTICLTATKPDRNPLFNQAGIDSEGRILYEITDQTTSAFGVFIAEFRIYNTKEVDGTTVNTLKSTYDFKINVAKSNVQDTEIVSTPEFNALTDAMASVGDLITDVTDAVERVNTALIDTGIAINNANTKAMLADEKAILADEKATQANNAALLANEKAGLADTATSNANIATTNANTATTNAINATSNANTATTNAQNAADYANGVATTLDNETLKIFKPAVSTYAVLLTTYPTPENGWTVTVTDEVVSYRYNGTEWIDLGVISSVDTATDTTLGIVKGGGNVTIGIDGEMNVDLSGKINTTEKGAINGVATLDETGKVLLTQIPDGIGGGGDAEDITYGETTVAEVLDDHTSQLASTVKKVNNVVPDITGNITIEFPDPDLSGYAEKSYVDTLTQSIASGSPKGTYATLTDLQTAFPVGDTNVYLVIANGNWYYWNGSAWVSGGVYQSTGIANRSVTPDKTSFVVLGKNLFNKDTVTVGKVLRGTYSDLLDNVYYDTSDFIEVSPNTIYTRKSSGVLVFLDEGKEYISSITSETTFTTPINAKHIRMSMATVVDKETQQLELGSVSTQYEPYHFILQESIVPEHKDAEIVEARMEHPSLKDSILAFSSYKKSKNLFNKETVVVGNLRITAGDVLTGSVYYDTSDWIKATADTTYTRAVFGVICFYNASKGFISAVENVKTFTTPANTEYIRISMAGELSTNDKEAEQLEIGGKATTYEPFGIINTMPKASLWADTKANFIGDSITKGTSSTNYVSKVGQILNLTLSRNYGIGGCALCYRNAIHTEAIYGAESNQMIDTVYPPVISRWQDMSDDADIIFMMIGTNDFTSQVPLGAVDSINTNEFNGCLNIVLKGLRDKYPTKLIIISTILDRNITDIKPITLETYNQAITDMCKKYKLICYNAYNETGFDFKYDYTSNTKATTDDGLHPNATGSQILGQRIAGFINSH